MKSYRNVLDKRGATLLVSRHFAGPLDVLVGLDYWRLKCTDEY